MCLLMPRTISFPSWKRVSHYQIARMWPCWLVFFIKECGAGFTKDLESMFTDMEISRDLAAGFKVCTCGDKKLILLIILLQELWWLSFIRWYIIQREYSCTRNVAIIPSMWSYSSNACRYPLSWWHWYMLFILATMCRWENIRDRLKSITPPSTREDDWYGKTFLDHAQWRPIFHPVSKI